ncbi:TRAP transporter substrate-binding protein [Phaeovulum vinaykumarii]|uniref:TRAP-type C4-dicarboxylate transport system, substrate-binding protein n=1 Tax=Phaeovulum vinaykumarii TaxID=407234 RepID=A0A1N7KAA4_9RHOB|nr:TRAP transporter substrate-binding protein [Phaeovulum vinaykumarii]SIS58527.1 TRAP-type C4-dicarboxylate transport system, substrate-binding protein [Phaeovulum vinaykumarii]SOB93827.1 TRAP-type C4-dicarboxylate transport system substrate-binding protein [Phaeovulum vinaykumarii]
MSHRQSHDGGVDRGRRRLTLGALGAAAALAAPGVLRAADVHVLRLHQFLPAQSFVPAQILDPWADAIETASEGRLRIQRFPSMQLGGKPPELIDQITDGIVDIIWTLPGYTPGRFPRIEAFELPFQVRDARGASAALWEIAESDLSATEFRAMKLLGTWVHGPGVLHVARPVARLEDMAGLRLRAPSRATALMLEGMGAQALGMPVPAVPEALARGVIDGALLPWEVTSSIKAPELVHYHTEFPDRGIYVASFILAMNRTAFDRLPADLQAVIEAQSGAAFSAQAGALQQGADAPAREVARDLGNQITMLDAAEAARWEAAGGPVIERWLSEMAEAGIDGTDLLARVRAAIARHGG